MNKFIMLCLVALLYQNWGAIDRYLDPSAAVQSGEVILFATSWCGYCKKARALLRDNNIAFVEYDIEKSAVGKQRYDQLKGRGVPVLLINNEVVYGYNPRKILALATGR